MKTLTALLAFLCLSSLLSSQERSGSKVFWNDYSLYNPAMTGFDGYRLDSRLITRLLSEGNSAYYSSVYLDKPLQNNKGAMSLSYQSTFSTDISYHDISASSSKYFDLGNNKVLSLGASIGYRGTLLEPGVLNSEDPGGFVNQNLHMDFGIGFKTERLRLGLSMSGLNYDLEEPSEVNFSPGFNINAAYNFKLADNLNLVASSRILLQRHIYGDQLLSGQAYVKGEFIYKEKFFLGAAISDDLKAMSFSAGVLLKERLKLNYSLNTGTGSLKGATHSIGIGFMFN